MKLLLLILLVPLLASMELVGASKKGSLRASLFSSYDKRVKPDEEVKVKFGVSVQGLNYCPKYEVLRKRELHAIVQVHLAPSCSFFLY